MTTNAPLARPRPWRRARLAVVAAAGVTAAGSLLPVAAHATDPALDPSTDPAVIVHWNRVAMDVLTPSGRPLLTQPFVVAAMHVAVYDAVVAIEGGYRPFAASIDAPDGASPAAAAAVAAHDVLVAFLPANASTFDAALTESLAAIPDGASEDDGVTVGQLAAQATLAERLDDGSQAGPMPPARTPGPGVWQPTPPATVGLAPWLAYAEPFTMSSPDQFRPKAPPALDSKQYRRAIDELRRVGGATSTQRTADQTAIARFWADQPVAQNQRALRAHATQLGWDIAGTARLFAAVMTSEADAIIGCWDAKFHYQLWRPWQSVPVTEPGWTPLLATPNHPEFPSAHSCLTGSLAYSLARLMGTEQIDLDIDAVSLGVTRHYETRDDLLTEVGNARVWGGIHHRFSVEAGLRLAHRVVNLNLRRNFQPIG